MRIICFSSLSWSYLCESFPVVSWSFVDLPILIWPLTWTGHCFIHTAAVNWIFSLFFFKQFIVQLFNVQLFSSFWNTWWGPFLCHFEPQFDLQQFISTWLWIAAMWLDNSLFVWTSIWSGVPNKVDMNASSVGEFQHFLGSTTGLVVPRRGTVCLWLGPALVMSLDLSVFSLYFQLLGKWERSWVWRQTQDNSILVKKSEFQHGATHKQT